MDALHYTYPSLLKDPAHSGIVEEMLRQFDSDLIDSEELEARRQAITRLRKLGESKIANRLASRLRSIERSVKR